MSRMIIRITKKCHTCFMHTSLALSAETHFHQYVTWMSYMSLKSNQRQFSCVVHVSFVVKKIRSCY